VQRARFPESRSHTARDVTPDVHRLELSTCRPIMAFVPSLEESATVRETLHDEVRQACDMMDVIMNAGVTGRVRHFRS